MQQYRFYIGKVAELRRATHMQQPPKGALVIDLAERERYMRRMRKAEEASRQRQLRGDDAA